MNIALALLNKNKKEVISQTIPLINESQQKPFWACYDNENECNLLLKKGTLLISKFT